MDFYKIVFIQLNQDPQLENLNAITKLAFLISVQISGFIRESIENSNICFKSG